MESCLNMINVLSRKASLTINKKEKFTTKTGSLFSIIIILLLFFFTGYYLNKIVGKEIQTIFSRTEDLSVSPTFNFSNNFPFLFRIEDNDSNQYIDDTMLIPKVDYYICKKNVTWSCTNYSLNFSSCSAENFPSRYSQFFSKHNLEKAFCLEIDRNPGLNGSLAISGSWLEESIRYISISVIMCDILKNSSCYGNASLINDFLTTSNIYMALYSLEENLNPQNYDEPGSPSMTYDYFLLSLNAYKLYHNFISLTLIKSDIGLVSQDFNITSLNSNQLYLRDSNYINLNKVTSLGTYLFYSSNRLTVVTRNYLRIQAAVTIVSSVINSAVIILNIIISPLVEKKLYETIVSKIIAPSALKHTSYEYNLKKNIGKVKKSNTETFSDMNILEPGNYMKRLENTLGLKHRRNKVETKPYLKRLENLTKLFPPIEGSVPRINRKIFLTYFEFVLYHFFPCWRRKMQIDKHIIFKQSKGLIQEYTDIVTLVKLNLQFEFLKSLLFSPRERGHFDWLYRHMFNEKFGAGLATLLRPDKKYYHN